MAEWWVRSLLVLQAPRAVFVALPLELAVGGEDLFRGGGSAHGRGGAALGGVELGFLVWGVALLVVGVRSVHGWTWARAGAALGAAGVPIVALTLYASLS